MYTFLLSEFIRLSKFELERELPQTTDQSKVVTLVSRFWYRVSRLHCFEDDAYAYYFSTTARDSTVEPPHALRSVS